MSSRVALDPDISAADLLQQQDMIIEVAFFGKKTHRPQEFLIVSAAVHLKAGKPEVNLEVRLGGEFRCQGEGRWDLVYFSSLCFCEASGLGKFPPPLMVAGNVEF